MPDNGTDDPNVSPMTAKMGFEADTSLSVSGKKLYVGIGKGKTARVWAATLRPRPRRVLNVVRC
jgi:hypothetical protein